MNHNDKCAASFLAEEKLLHRYVLYLFLLCMLPGTILISFVLSAGAAYFANDVLHPALYTFLTWTSGVLDPVLFFICMGLLGYTVIRWGLRKSAAFVWLALGQVFLQQCGALFALCVQYTFSIAFESIVCNQYPVLLMNLGVRLLEVIILTGFCAVYRTTHTNHAVMRVGIPLKIWEQKKNPLHKVYFFMNCLIALFSLVPAFLQAISDYTVLGFFQNTQEFFTFIKPFLFVLIFFFLGQICLDFSGFLVTCFEKRIRKKGIGKKQ